MSKVGGWFKAKRVRGRAYLAEKNPVCTPSDRWWIYIIIAKAFAASATVTFKQLNRHSVTVSMQREYLKSLMLFYIECVGAKGPFLADGGKADTLDSNEWHVLTSKNFSASLVEVKSFVHSLRLRSQKECLLFGTLDPRRNRFN
ncbi:unnamed protein product [Peronospora farinosa]|uniref:LAGLIDADG endonuclease n=1 Tax=Peronospora farinosa TaxID=134698 RepID=A0AAV0TI81_9STRA|nr:unnamed protein product [Peronospora farinosa]